MSQGPRHINTDRSLNRPTEQRPTEASALHQVSLSGQPDFFQNEQPAPSSRNRPARARAADAAAMAAVGRPGTRPPLMRPAAAKRRKRPPCGCRWP